MAKYLDFEKQLADIEGEIHEREVLFQGAKEDMALGESILNKKHKRDKLLKKIYDKLTPWQKVQVARHPDRPQFQDYLSHLFQDFTPLAGDRLYAEETTITGGLAKFQGRSVMVIGQQKGRSLEERVKYKFGYANPEGYRKAQRLINLASYYRLPILSFIDTPGAGAGVEAEERGQGEAIAKGIQCCLRAEVPLVAIVIGEGFSGGAIAIGASDRFLMLEHAVFTVISPEACASILWKDPKFAETAAQALKLTAQDVQELKLLDEIVQEPLGGAHRNPKVLYDSVTNALTQHLKSLSPLSGKQLVTQRRKKFLDIA